LTSQTIIETKEVSLIDKTIQPEKIVVNKISFQFKSGKIYSIVGLSGSGKSSYLRLINNLDSWTSGEVLYNNKSILNIDPCFLRKKIGYLFQYPYLFDGSARDNILFANDQLTGSEIETLAERVNFPLSLIDKDGAQLSGGEKQRIAMARLLALDPDVFLLDEPTSAMDPLLTTEIEKLILELVYKENKTVVIVTHLLEQALRLKGEALLIVDGEIANFGETEQVINNWKEKELKQS
jgi:putative ABC transport system ATP-binding protein